nr:Extra-large GTP-binding protein 3 [Ipomoea batatas]
MGELESVAKAKKELEEIYLGVPDDSVNLTFQDFVRLTNQEQQPFNLSVNSLGSDDNKLEIDEPIYTSTVLARLPSLDFKQALEAASSRYPTHNHNHSHSSCSPQQNRTLQEQLNLTIENPVKSVKSHSPSSHSPQQNHPLQEKSNLPTENHVKSAKTHRPSFRSPQQDHPLQERSNLPTENPVTSAKSHSYHGHHDHHDTRVHAHQTINARHHHQHRKQILQRGHGGEAHGNNHATDMHDNVSGQHHAIPCHDSSACRHRHAYDHYDTVSRTSETMSTGSGVSATATPPYQGRRRRPGTPHSKICTLCSTHAYIFRHRCLVCGRVYCRQCVRVGMGDMSEGRKYIQRAGQMGCCMGYPSIVKQQELKWAEKGPKRSGDSRPERSGAISRSRSPAQTSPIITHSPGPTPSFGMESPYSPYTPTRHYPLPF